MQIGCHSLIFGAFPPEQALTEIARAHFECAVLAEIEGQAQHASRLPHVPLVPLGGVDVAASDPRRVASGLSHADRLGAPFVIATPNGRPRGGGLGLAHSLGPLALTEGRLTVTPRAGSSVWNVGTALRLAERGAALWPDTSHLARAGEDLPAAARALTPYSAGWFIRDHGGTSPGPGAFETQVPGRGVLDLRGVLQVLRDEGFTGPIVFHAVGHLPRGRLRTGYSLERLRELAREAQTYLFRYSTSCADRPT